MYTSLLVKLFSTREFLIYNTRDTGLGARDNLAKNLPYSAVLREIGFIICRICEKKCLVGGG